MPIALRCYERQQVGRSNRPESYGPEAVIQLGREERPLCPMSVVPVANQSRVNERQVSGSAAVGLNGCRRLMSPQSQPH